MVTSHYQIWDLSDPNGRGHLDKKGFFTALKLVALAQAGETINIKNIHMETQNPPKVVSNRDMNLQLKV